MNNEMHPEGVRERENLSLIWSLYHPSGVLAINRSVPEVFASLRPPATFAQPCGLQRFIMC